MNHVPPKNWVVYGGADGFDGIPDAAGYMWWGDNMWVDGKKDSTFQFILCRQKNNVSEIIQLPEVCNGAGRLNWTPAGLYVSVTHNLANLRVNKSFFIHQYAQFTQATPVILQTVNTATSAVDPIARQAAAEALSEAQRAERDVEQAALARPTFAQATAGVDKRIMQFLAAMQKNDRSDPLNAFFMDVMFKKVNDWIYGFAKDHGLLK